MDHVIVAGQTGETYSMLGHHAEWFEGNPNMMNMSMVADKGVVHETGNNGSLDFKKETDKYFRPIMEMGPTEIELLVKEYVESKIARYELPVKVKNIAIYGSRSRGSERVDSDLDVVVEYEGDFREDELFNLLHEDDFKIHDIVIDINPITKEKTGTLGEYLKQAQEYMGKEQAFRVGNRYLVLQETEEGYDYSILAPNYTEIDGGVIEHSKMSIWEMAEDIVKDLAYQSDFNGAKGNITPETVMEPVNYADITEKMEGPQKVYFYVAECGEFHGLGRVYGKIDSVDEAVKLFEKLKKGGSHLVPELGIHTEDDELELSILQKEYVDIGFLNHIPYLCQNRMANERIIELVIGHPEYKLLSEQEEKILADCILRVYDSHEELFSENERDVIREHLQVVKNPNATMKLVESMYYQLAYGNEDVALLVIKAKEEMDAIRNMPDATVRTLDMQQYGYTDEGMYPLGKERALQLFDDDHAIFLLYPDESEALAESREEIETFDGMFGIEKTVWDRTKEKEIEQKEPERSKHGTIKTR